MDLINLPRVGIELPTVALTIRDCTTVNSLSIISETHDVKNIQDIPSTYNGRKPQDP